MAIDMYNTFGMNKLNLGGFGNAMLKGSMNGDKLGDTLFNYMQSAYGKPQNTPTFTQGMPAAGQPYSDYSGKMIPQAPVMSKPIQFQTPDESIPKPPEQASNDSGDGGQQAMKSLMSLAMFI